MQVEILNTLNYIKIIFGNDSRTDNVTFKIGISEDCNLLEEKIIIASEKIEPTSELIDYFINNVYLNKEYLPSLYKNLNEKDVRKLEIKKENILQLKLIKK